MLPNKGGVLERCAEIRLLDAALRRGFLEVFRKMKPKDRPSQEDACGDTFCQVCRHREHVLNALQAEIISADYERGPFRCYQKRKPWGGTRTIQVPTHKDRIAARGLLELLLCDTRTALPDVCCGGVRGRGLAHAMREVAEEINKGKLYAVYGDVEKFYDKIPHKALTDVVRIALPDCPVLDTVWELALSAEEKGLGIVQGVALSPLLGDLYLRDVDLDFVQREVFCRRYVDDIIILVGSRSAACRNLQRLAHLLNERSLNLKDTTGKASRVTNLATGREVRFLGIEFRQRKVSVPEDVRRSLRREVSGVQQLVKEKETDKARLEWEHVQFRLQYYQDVGAEGIGIDTDTIREIQKRLN